MKGVVGLFIIGVTVLCLTAIRAVIWCLTVKDWSSDQFIRYLWIIDLIIGAVFLVIALIVLFILREEGTLQIIEVIKQIP